jgi:hypothetical protein
MPTTIDSLQIEIQSSSTNASQGIRDLAKSLGELKTNGTVNVAIKNLNNLSSALKNFTDASNATRSVGRLVGALGKLKEVGSVTSIGTSLTKLSAAMKTLETVNLDRVEPKIIGIVHAVEPLSSIKSGGLGSMVNALAKIGKVTESLNDEKIDAFAERVEKLGYSLDAAGIDVAFGRFKEGHEYSAVWHVKKKDLTLTLEDTRKRYGVEKHGIEADPLFVDGEGRNFQLRKGSPAFGKGKDGKNIGADFSVFK